jgi:hypothetical protein
MTMMIDLGGGCMPLYSSKGLDQNNFETRRNNTICIKFLTNSKRYQENPFFTKNIPPQKKRDKQQEIAP